MFTVTSSPSVPFRTDILQILSSTINAGGWVSEVEPLPSLSNILPRFLLQLPKVLGFFSTKIPLQHNSINQCLLNTLSHTLTATTDKHSPIQTIDNEPDQVRLGSNFILDIFALARMLAALNHLLDLRFVHAPFTGIELIKKGISHALQNPDFVSAVCIL